MDKPGREKAVFFIITIIITAIFTISGLSKSSIQYTSDLAFYILAIVIGWWGCDLDKDSKNREEVKKHDRSNS